MCLGNLALYGKHLLVLPGEYLLIRVHSYVGLGACFILMGFYVHRSQVSLAAYSTCSSSYQRRERARAKRAVDR